MMNLIKEFFKTKSSLKCHPEKIFYEQLVSKAQSINGLEFKNIHEAHKNNTKLFEIALKQNGKAYQYYIREHS